MAFKSEARAIAPDIWHKRDMSATIRAFSGAAAGSQVDRPALAATVVEGDTALTAYSEWRRLMADGTNASYLPTAWAATEELRAAGLADLPDADPLMRMESEQIDADLVARFPEIQRYRDNLAQLRAAAPHTEKNAT